VKRVEIVAYCDDDCDDDIDRAVGFLCEHVGPHLIIVGRSEVDEDRLAEILAESEDDVVPD
jgi:hypothetical protein